MKHFVKMILSYKNFLKVLLFIVLFGTNSFPQKNAWKWFRNNYPAANYLVSFVANGFLYGTGEGGLFYNVPDKYYSILENYLEVDIIDAVVDPINKDVLVLADNWGEIDLLAVSLGDGHINVDKLATFYEPAHSVTVDSNKTIIAAKEIHYSIDRLQFKTYLNPDFDENSEVIKTPDQSNYLVFGHSTLGDGNGIRLTNDFINYQTPQFTWSHPISFDLARIPVGSYSPGSLGKILQNVPIFALGYQAATNSYVVCKSTDNGGSWDSVFAAPQNTFMTAMSVGSESNAIIGGNGFSVGELYYTKDGGNTWEKGYDSPHYIYSITHVSSDSAYAFGSNGLILLTTDGGVNWTQISEDHPNVSTIYFSSPSVGYSAGVNYNSLTVYKTTDSGDNWKVVYIDSTFSPSYGFLYSIYFIDDMTGFIAGSKFLKTTDGGMTWNEPNTGVSSDPNFGDPTYQDVYFVNDSLGFAIYRAFPTGDGVIKTTDGGTTWNPINIKNDKYDKQYVYFADKNLGFVSGYSTLYRTTDGGDSWDTLAVGTNDQNLNSKVTFINSTTGFFGKKGQVFKTTDRGDTWTDAAIDINSVPRQIQFVSDSIGYLNCVSDTFGIPIHILFKTTDGGNSWFDLTNELPVTRFQSMFFTDENTGYMAGDGIIKTTSGGENVITSVQVDNSSIPSGYKLYQNYPNPFNPSTTIQFNLPKESFTKLEIFNILGEKVTTLVSEMLSPGSYKYKWDAGRYSTGVYFYRITAGNFIQTKKLLLLK